MSHVVLAAGRVALVRVSRLFFAAAEVGSFNCSADGPELIGAQAEDPMAAPGPICPTTAGPRLRLSNNAIYTEGACWPRRSAKVAAFGSA